MKSRHLDRRTFMRGGLKTLLVGAGALAGYGAAKETTAGIDRVLEDFYGATHDALAEMSGIATKRLESSAEEVRGVIGTYEEDQVALAKYWDGSGLISEKDMAELDNILKQAEHFSEESNILERLTRLRDRAYKRNTAFDQDIESKYPEKVRSFNERFAQLIKGKERGSRESLDNYRAKLESLVEVYDANRDNVIAQTELLDQTGELFSNAQGEVSKKIEGYLASGELKGEEREYFVGLQKVIKEDPTGRELADFLLGTNMYFRDIVASEKMHEFSERLDETIDDLSELQEYMHKGIELKNEIRTMGLRNIDRLNDRADEYFELIEDKKRDLEAKGVDVEYELFPRMKATKDAIMSYVDKTNQIQRYGLTAAGAAIGAYVGRIVNSIPGIKKLSRREFLLQRENDELKSQLNDEGGETENL